MCSSNMCNRHVHVQGGCTGDVVAQRPAEAVTMRRLLPHVVAQELRNRRQTRA